MAIAPSAIFTASKTAIEGIARPDDVPESEWFQLAGGTIDDLLNTPGDRHFVIIARKQPVYAPERGAGNIESTIQFEIAFVYQWTMDATARMVDDSALVNRALSTLKTLEPNIQKVIVEALDYDYDAIENGIVASWLVTVYFFGGG